MVIATECSSIKDSLLAFFGDQISVSSVRNLCVVSVPIESIDGLSVDVFVEPKPPDFFVVHDAGKAISALECRGVSLGDAREESLAVVAGRYGVAFDDGMFQIGCKRQSLSRAVISVAQCASIAKLDLLRAKQVIEGHPTKLRVYAAVVDWAQSRRARVDADVPVDGATKQHTFDFVAQPNDGNAIAISVLSPGQSSQARAERYGYFVHDISGSAQYHWNRIAVLDRPADWSDRARSLVRRFATRVVDAAQSSAQINAAVSSALDEAAA